MPNLFLQAVFLTALFSSAIASAMGVEVFANGSASKNYITSDEYEVSVTAAGGIAVVLIPQLRIEARYSNITTLQNQQVVGGTVNGNAVAFTLTDVKTTTSVYSIGLDLDIVGEKYAVQPFLYVGAGWVDTANSYYQQTSASSTAQYVALPDNAGLSANVGAGFRIKVARSVAFEVQAFVYGLDLKQPNPLLNWTGTVGIRLFM